MAERAANDNIAPGNVYTLDEAAAHLRLTNRGVAKLARRHGLCLVRGRDILLTGRDIEGIKDVLAIQGAPDDLEGFDLPLTPSTQQEALGDTHIYVMSCEQFTKIGVAKNTTARLATLQTANPFEIKMEYSETLRSLIYAGLAERIAHHLLRAHKVRSEWFDVSVSDATAAVKRAANEVRLLYPLHDAMRYAA